MDGLTVTRRLKADPTTRDIPTLALTAHAMPKDLEKALEAGCAGTIAKPIDTVSFPQRVAATLRGRMSTGGPAEGRSEIV
jgi:CheY-like chemotaxis protein